MSLNFQKLEYAFTKGLNQKPDARSGIAEPDLVRALDVDFTETGGLRLRYPYASIGANIFGGGTISNCRRVYAVGSELILFTDTALYSWSSQHSAWVLRGTHLAVKTEEAPAFLNSTEQTDCDRAQLNGTVVYAWSQSTTDVYVAAQDASTGAVLMAPTRAALGGGAIHPRLCALETKILLLYEDTGLGGGLMGIAIDPASPATALAGAETTVLADADFDTYYDVEKIPGEDGAVVVARSDTNTQYTITVIDSALSQVTGTTQGLTCDGPIAVAVSPDATRVLVARGNGSNVKADILDLDYGAADLASDVDNAAMGSGGTLMHITGAWINNTTCHVFWSSSEATDATDWDTDHNTVTTAGTPGTAARLIRRCALASRAFAYDGDAYVWLAFAGVSSFSGASPSEFRAQLQNSYFLYRHDARLVAKAAWQVAGGLQTTGWLPGVQLTSGTTGFSWCGIERRVIPVGSTTREIAGTAQPIQNAYGDKGPRDITFTFDSNEARRVAKLGETVYITGGEILQYDGRELTEVGFHLAPHYFGAIEVGTGNLTDGVYTLKTTWRYGNARGERERSTTATHGQVTIAAGPNGISVVSCIPLYVTHKENIAVEVWRSAVNLGDPFYLATSPDPGSTSNPNRYITNDTTANLNATFNDEYADSTLTTKEPSPENEGVLENLAPPAATLIAANDTRLFLAGVAGDPHRVRYSKQRGDAEIAAFHDALAVPVPEAGGDITGLAFLNETLVVFRETAIYALDGIGFDNTGGGQNYQARLVSSTEGAVSHEAICLTPMGLIFKSSKGWYLLNRGWSTQYIGDKVCDYDSDTVYSAHVVESTHQVRIITSARCLMFDYVANAWAEWSIADGLHACMWNGTYHYLATSSVKAEQASYSTADYAMDVEMLFHLGGLQGFARVRKILVLGEVRGTGSIRVRIGSYEEDTYFDDLTWTISPTTAGKELNFQTMPSQQQHKALRVRLTTQATAGEKPKLSGITLDVGFKGGVFPHLPAAQRQ